jgi:hypothetical protein
MNLRAAPLACCVTDFNVLPLGALIFLAAANPWHNAEFSIEALHPNRFVRLVPRNIGEGSFYRFFCILALEYGLSLVPTAAMCALSPFARDLQPAIHPRFEIEPKFLPLVP